MSDLPRIAIVQLDRGWTPKAWNDFPAEATILKISQPVDSFNYAEGAVFVRNAPKLKSGKPKTWAVILRPGYRPQKGDRCARTCNVFDAA